MGSETEAALARAGLTRSKLSVAGCTRFESNTVDSSSRWSYVSAEGFPLEGPEEVERIDRLAIPPAWTDVWISPDPAGHIQAIGNDAKGRRQYRYHPRWTQLRAEEKFSDLTDFASFLPKIRRQIDKDLSVSGMPKAKAVALVVVLMDRYHIRVGNDEYARKNDSYGLTTLKEGHMLIDRSPDSEGTLDAVLTFTGKSAKEWSVRIWEDDLAQMIEDSGKVGGLDDEQDLFRYLGESGRDYDIKSHHINEYLDALTPRGRRVTAKEFRTWAATWKAASRLAGQLDTGATGGRKKTASTVVKSVSHDLGNTPAVCRSSYIHPAVLSDWNDGGFRERWNAAASRRKMIGLSREETSTLHYLRGRGN